MIDFNLKKPFNKTSAVDQHYRLVKRISAAKSDATIIKLCLEDIKLVHAFNKEYLQTAKAESKNMKMSIFKRMEYVKLPKSYPSFKKLAVVYEKQKEYQKAIEVCEEAIRAGYPDDGTEKGMRGRIDKLKAKL